MVDEVIPESGPAMTLAEQALNRRIDDIVALQKKSTPWYREGSLIVAVAAFVISIITTIASGYHTYRQDVDALKAQLRAAIESSGNIAVENAEYLVKYKNEQTSMLAISSALNVQNIVLAREAYSIVTSLGNSATSLDLSAAANALINSNDQILAEELLERAVTRSLNMNEYLGALRQLSAVQYQSGKHGEGIKNFARVLDVCNQYPNECNNKSYVHVTQAYSHVFWANVVMPGDCASARDNLAIAEQDLAKLPQDLQQARILRAQVASMAPGISGCK